jgi:hypothetical protein
LTIGDRSAVGLNVGTDLVVGRVLSEREVVFTRLYRRRVGVRLYLLETMQNESCQFFLLRQRVVAVLFTPRKKGTDSDFRSAKKN